MASDDLLARDAAMRQAAATKWLRVATARLSFASSSGKLAGSCRCERNDQPANNPVELDLRLAISDLALVNRRSVAVLLDIVKRLFPEDTWPARARAPGCQSASNFDP